MGMSNYSKRSISQFQYIYYPKHKKRKQINLEKEIMKKSTQLLLLGVLLSAFATQAQNKITGNEKVITQKRSTANYDEINVAGFFDVVLVAGSEGAITVEGEENIVPHVKIEVSGKTLKIHSDNFNLKANENITITVPIEQINSISLSGSGDITTKTPINSPKLEAKLSGSGDLSLDVKSSDVAIFLSGSGDIVLRGTAENLSTKTSGSGDVDAVDLVSKNANITVSGSGDTKVNCTQNLYVRVSGSGDVQYKGNPATKDSKVSGSGEISRL